MEILATNEQDLDFIATVSLTLEHLLLNSSSILLVELNQLMAYLHWFAHYLPLIVRLESCLEPKTTKADLVTFDLLFTEPAAMLKPDCHSPFITMVTVSRFQHLVFQVEKQPQSEKLKPE